MPAIPTTSMPKTSSRSAIASPSARSQNTMARKWSTPDPRSSRLSAFPAPFVCTSHTLTAVSWSKATSSESSLLPAMTASGFGPMPALKGIASWSHRPRCRSPHRSVTPGSRILPPRSLVVPGFPLLPSERTIGPAKRRATARTEHEGRIAYLSFGVTSVCTLVTE